MFRRGDVYFYVFDLLWHDGEVRELPLIERKARLQDLMPRKPSRLLYVGHIEQYGSAFFE
jgi:bifunctional non-homologous end joining protein LigD